MQRKNNTIFVFSVLFVIAAIAIFFLWVLIRREIILKATLNNISEDAREKITERIVVEGGDSALKGVSVLSASNIAFFDNSGEFYPEVLSADFKAQAVLLTSDGWAFSAESKIDNYRAVMDGEVLQKERALKFDNGIFVKFNVHTGQLLPIVAAYSLNAGDKLYFRNANGFIFITFIKGITTVKVKSADDFWRTVILQENPPREFFGAPAVLNSGELVGFWSYDANFIVAEKVMNKLNKQLSVKNVDRFFGAQYSDLVEFMSLDKNITKYGAILREVNNNGLFAKNGLKKDDIITAVNGEILNNKMSFAEVLRQFDSKRIVIEYMRDNERKIVEIKE